MLAWRLDETTTSSHPQRMVPKRERCPCHVVVAGSADGTWEWTWNGLEHVCQARRQRGASNCSIACRLKSCISSTLSSTR